MEKQKNIPKLRFPEFKGEWETKEIGEILTIGNGRDYKHLKYGNIPVFGTGGLMTKVDDYLYDGETVCIGRKGTIDKPIYFNGKIWTVDTLFYTYDYKLSSVKFIYNIFQRINWKNYNEASGVPSLSKSTIEKIEITIPTLPEQTRIASFFTVLDKKIAELKQKKNLLEQYKKGVMQKIFSQEIRFKDDEGKEFPEWEVKKLGQLAERMSRKNNENNTNVLTISAQQGLVSQLEFFNKSVSAKDVSGYYLLKKGGFAYNKSYSNGYPMGAIKCLKYYEKGVVSTLYICFTFFESVDISFMEQYFESGIHNKEIESVAQEGARNHGLLNIGLSDFFNTEILIPCLKEQTKIANFLSSLDEKIKQCSTQIEKTVQWKKGLLQQMFC